MTRNMYTLFTLIVLQASSQFVGAFKEYRVSTSEEFQHTLDKALPDDQIILSGGVYHGPFTILRSGSDGEPIQLATFDRDMAQILGNGLEPALNLKGNHWLVSDLTIFNNNSLGLLISGGNNIVSNLKITKVDTAIQITGPGNIVENCYIYRAKTGIDVMGNRTTIVNNLFHEKDVTCVKIGKGTCCGRLIGNVCLFGEDVNDGRDYVVVGGTSQH